MERENKAQVFCGDVGSPQKHFNLNYKHKNKAYTRTHE